MKKLFLLIFPLILGSATVQNDDWKKDLENILYEFMSCGGPTAPNTPCNEFLGKALKKVYRITDFEKPGGRFLLANQIADYVAVNTDKWTLLGKGSEQTALDEAQGYANLKKAVIAVYRNATGYGHVALVLPGKTAFSSGWKLNTPNSASFFLDNPKGAFISKPLSFAFGADKKDDVLLYGRNY